MSTDPRSSTQVRGAQAGGAHTGTVQAIYIQGMTCQGCVRSVRAALEQAVPGLGVEVELASGTVLFDRAVAESVVRDAVEGAGYDYAGPVAADSQANAQN